MAARDSVRRSLRTGGDVEIERRVPAADGCRPDLRTVEMRLAFAPRTDIDCCSDRPRLLYHRFFGTKVLLGSRWKQRSDSSRLVGAIPVSVPEQCSRQ